MLTTPLTSPLDRDEVPPQFVPLSSLLASLVDEQRAERGLRPLTMAELQRVATQVARILFPVCTQAEPEI